MVVVVFHGYLFCFSILTPLDSILRKCYQILTFESFY